MNLDGMGGGVIAAKAAQQSPDQELYDQMQRIREQSAQVIDNLERQLAEQRCVHQAACAACEIFERVESSPNGGAR